MSDELLKFKVEDRYQSKRYSIDHQIIFIDEDIDKLTIGEYLRAIHMMTDRSKPIQVIIMSDGGGIYDGLALYDALEEAEANGFTVHTHATGSIMSMAFVIFMAGSKRTCSKRATFMNHKGETLIYGNDDNLELSTKEMKRVEKVCNTIIAEKTDYPKKGEIKKNTTWWNRHIRKGDRYYDREEALKLGIITE